MMNYLERYEEWHQAVYRNFTVKGGEVMGKCLACGGNIIEITAHYDTKTPSSGLDVTGTKVEEPVCESCGALYSKTFLIIMKAR